MVVRGIARSFAQIASLHFRRLNPVVVSNSCEYLFWISEGELRQTFLSLLSSERFLRNCADANSCDISHTVR